MPSRMAIGLVCARPHRHGLAAHQLGRAHDQHVRVVEMNVEGLPGSLQQHRVAGLQHDAAAAGLRSAGVDLGAAALHGEDDEVAALGDHARETRSGR